jgi:hypothetical protein
MIIQAEVSENVVGIVAIITTFVFFPIAIGVARLIWRRAGEPPRTTVKFPDESARLAQMQQTIDAMSIEIERISEGQRFLTKLLSDKERAPALRAGQDDR